MLAHPAKPEGRKKGGQRRIGSSNSSMFGGIVAGRGRVEAVEAVAGAALRLHVDLEPLGERVVAHGESIAVNGVCLTVVDCASGRASFDVIGETLRRTTLGSLRVGDLVNLEAALRVGDPVGGHEVQGHVDAVGTIRGIERRSDETWMTIAAPDVVHRTLVEKGWVTVDGASLTVAALHADAFSVALIPTTLALTTLAGVHEGSNVNLEGDPLGRHLARWMAARGFEV